MGNNMTPRIKEFMEAVYKNKNIAKFELTVTVQYYPSEFVFVFSHRVKSGEIARYGKIQRINKSINTVNTVT